MKNLNELKQLYKMYVDSTNDFDTKLSHQLLKIKMEHKKVLAEEKLKLLSLICDDMNLDINEMKIKYLKSKEINVLSDDNPKIISEVIEEKLLDKIEWNGKHYYYEPKEKGIVYDLNSDVVGFYVNNKILLS